MVPMSSCEILMGMVAVVMIALMSIALAELRPARNEHLLGARNKCPLSGGISGIGEIQPNSGLERAGGLATTLAPKPMRNTAQESEGLGERGCPTALR
ncbi:hypothetical protein L209DRAFT_758547 [Thermothelomyces heterothallicus CBS 203.75]